MKLIYKNIQQNLFFACIGSLLLVACSDVEIQEENYLDIPVIQLAEKDTTVTKQYVCEITALRNVEIRAKVDGFLEKIYVDEGKEVSKGQLLFGINKEQYKAELAKANANLKSAIANAKSTEMEVERVRILVEKEVVSKSELTVAKAKFIASESQVEEARAALSNASIRYGYTNMEAPFSGVIDRIPLKVGSLVDQGTLLTTISDNSSVYTYFNVSETEYLSYMKLLNTNESSSNVVFLNLADGSRYPYPGKIETLEGEFDAGTGTIAFRAKFPNPDKLLKHGATGRVSLSTKVNAALIIPQKSVFEIQDRNYVFVMDSSNTVHIRSFVPKFRFSHFYIVGTGLQAGDKVVYEGIQNLKDKMQIEPVMYNLDSLMANVSKAQP